MVLPFSCFIPPVVGTTLVAKFYTSTTIVEAPIPDQDPIDNMKEYCNVNQAEIEFWSGLNQQYSDTCLRFEC